MINALADDDAEISSVQSLETVTVVEICLPDTKLCPDTSVPSGTLRAGTHQDPSCYHGTPHAPHGLQKNHKVF